MSETVTQTRASRGTVLQFVQNAVLRGLIGALLLLPYGARVRGMGWLAARVLAPLVGWRRRIRENLAHVLPDLPRAEVERLVRAVPDNVGRTVIETYSGRAFAARARAAPMSGPGLAALDAARDAGRPVILVTGHFGNYVAIRPAMEAHGHRMGVLYRAMSNPWFNDHYVASLAAIGEPLFEQGRRGMVEMVRHLRGGGVLGILTDLNAWGGVPLDFFGKPALTSTVTAELALKYDAALIPVYAIRGPDGLSFDIRVLEEVPRTDPETMTQAVNDGLEALVRAHMGQWFWIHRRWKGGQPG